MRTSAIALVSKDIQSLLNVGQRLKTFSDLGEIVTVHAPIGALPEWHIPPQVLVAIEGSGEATSFDHFSMISRRYPDTALVLMAEESSAEVYVQAMRSGVREVVVYGDPPEKLYWVLKRLRHVQDQAQRRLGKVMGFTSCKGGGGATFLATNLASALAEYHQQRVVTIDLNLHFGDAAMFVTDQQPEKNIATLMRNSVDIRSEDLEASLLEVSPGCYLLASPEYPGTQPYLGAEGVSHLIEVAKTLFDFVVLDIGRSIDQMSLTALDRSDRIFPIFQNTIPNLRDGRRLIDVYRAMGYPDEKIAPVMNRHDPQGDIKLHHLEVALTRKIERIIPNHYEAVAQSVNQGVPVIRLAKTSPVSKSLRLWAQEVVGKPAEEPRSWVSRVLH